MKSTTKLMLRVAAVVLFVSALTPLSQAQRVTSENERLTERERQEMEARDAREREARRSALEEELSKPAHPKTAKLSVAQISEDFMRIQVINDELFDAVKRGGALNLKFVGKSTSGIKKRAERLKENLMLPEVEQGWEHSYAGPVDDADKMKPALRALDKLITSFVRNQIFKEQKVSDIEMSTKARKDLEEIIELSDQITKSSEKLLAAPQTP
jgi:hypothetical protein